jgi:hypothetical protein
MITRPERGLVRSRAGQQPIIGGAAELDLSRTDT